MCEFLEVERHVFDSICQNRDALMRVGKMPKRHGGYRVVFNAKDDALRNLLRTIRRRIDRHYSFRDCVQGFVRGRSIVSNASQHLGKKVVVNADIQDFFQTITVDRVQEVFLSMGFNRECAEILAALITLNGALVTGFSPSPVISNVICEGLDTDFLALAAEHNASYTRYADDISISGDGGMPGREQIEAIIAKHGFKMNPDKYRVQRKGGSQYVTGLTVCDPQQPHLPRRLKRRLRLETYYIQKDGGSGSIHLSHHVERATPVSTVLPLKMYGISILGWIYFVSGIEGKFANWLMQKWRITDADAGDHSIRKFAKYRSHQREASVHGI